MTFGEPVSFLTVTASSVNADAEIAVNGQPVAAGDASSPIYLEEGANPDVIVITVTHPHGFSRTYRISVTTPVTPEIPVPQPGSGAGPRRNPETAGGLAL